MNNNFIWIINPKYQKAYHTVFCDKTGYNLALVEFRKEHRFEEKIKEVRLKIFADYSHAWGATPTYQLPKMIAGFKILKPGFEEISLNPNLFGLMSAEIVIPTPRGNIEIKLGEKTEIIVPDGIKVKDA